MHSFPAASYARVLRHQLGLSGPFPAQERAAALLEHLGSRVAVELNPKISLAYAWDGTILLPANKADAEKAAAIAELAAYTLEPGASEEWAREFGEVFLK